MSTKLMLRRLAEEIRDERRIGANTAARVGTALLSIIENLNHGEFLSKTEPDQTEYLLKLLAGAQFGKFVSGMIGGRGAAFDELGNLEAESGTFRSSLRVLELMYNRITVNDGKHFWSAGGVVVKCTQETDTSYLLQLRKDFDTDFVKFKVDDILLGNFNQSGGFFNSYMRVIFVDTSANTILVVVGHDTAVPSGKNYPPCELMHLARIGNFTDTSRQSSIYMDAENLELCMFDGVDSYIIPPEKRKTFIGKLNSPADLGLPENLPVNKGDMVGFFDVLLAKHFFQVDERNQVIKMKIERDGWRSDPRDMDGVYYPYINNEREEHYVYWLNCKWKCIVPEATKGVPPASDNPEWLLVSGDTTLSMEIRSTNGWMFRPTEVDTELVVTVRRGIEDVTHLIRDTDWEWRRESGSPTADTSWNSAHADTTHTLHISYAAGDLGPYWAEKDIKYTCIAYFRVGEEVQTIIQSKSIRK